MLRRGSSGTRVVIWFAIVGLVAVVALAGCKSSQTETATGGAGAQTAAAGAQGAGAAGGQPGGAAATAGGPAGGGGGMRGGGGGMRGGGGGMRGGGGGMRGGGGGMRGGGGGMRGGGGGRRGGGGGGAAAAAAPAEAGPTKVQPQKLTDVEKAKKLQAFSALYGPVTVVKEKNWDGAELEYARFKYQGQQIKLPMGIIYDARTPKELAGYFGMYAVGGKWR